MLQIRLSPSSCVSKRWKKSSSVIWFKASRYIAVLLDDVFGIRMVHVT
ncbi:hypothetical protein VCR12J2_1370050 [Vibrio coralliirubri]|nr:hypothetical protein VCR12J2_1370050 [Vibrio coralliirubri]